MMEMIKRVLGNINDILLNRNAGSFSWVIHRLTGLVLAGYIFMHLVVLSSEFVFGPGSFNWLMGMFKYPLFRVLEICLIGVIFSHMFNGLRLIGIDLFGLTRKHVAILWIAAVFFLAGMAATLAVFIPHILKYYGYGL
ncbi:MAG: hypothetical protein V1701_00310 [Planctomycetota bacterium]